MKKLLVSIFLLTLSASVFAEERAVGVALERFSVIAGGWWLNKNCKLLSEEKAAEFSRDVAVINTSLTTTLDNPSLIMSIQASGKKVSESEPFASCSNTANEVVSYSVLAANQWATEIRKTVLETATKLPGAPK
jgi:hypothetical protein